MKSLSFLLAIAFTTLLAPAGAQAAAIVQRIGVSTFTDGTSNTLDLYLQGATGTYVAGDGSVRTIPDDGSVRLVSGGIGSAALCFQNVTPSGTFADGTSNTLLFNESSGLQVTAGFATGLKPVSQVLDGTSNTITFPESHSLCLGDVTFGNPVTGSITDGTSNTITFGEGSTFDFCFGSARLGSISDGTSNTISFSEARNGVCYQDVGIGPGLTVAENIAEPPSVAVLLVALLAMLLSGPRKREGSVQSAPRMV